MSAIAVLYPESVDDFKQIVARVHQEGKQLVMCFSAVWCGPCKALAPDFERWAVQYAKWATFVKVDVDKLESVAEAFKVTAMPTTVVATPAFNPDTNSIAMRVDDQVTGGSGVLMCIESNIRKST